MRTISVILLAAVLLLPSCSDDDGDDSSSESVPIPTIEIEDGEVDLDQLNADLTEYLEASDNADAFSGRLEITAIEGDDVTIAPVEGEDITADEAESACEAMASVVYQSLPTAVIVVEDASGTELASSGGPGGTCEAS